MKKLLNQLLLTIVGPIGAFLIWVLGKSLRIEWIDEDYRTQIKGGVLYAFWHSRLLILAYTHRWRGALIMISESQDGEFIARPVERLGFLPIRGSTSRSGLKALFRMAKQISSDHDGAITPDGPRGPRQKVQIGTILIAQRAQVPIIPIITSAEKCWRLNSWDRFMIPKPFSRAVVIHGQPIEVPSKLDRDQLEAIRQDVENSLNELTKKADHFFDTNLTFC